MNDEEKKYPLHGEYIVSKIMKNDVKAKKYRLKLWEKANSLTVKAVKSINRGPTKLKQSQIKMSRLNDKLLITIVEAINESIARQEAEVRKEQQLITQAQNSGITLIIKKAHAKATARRRKK